MDDNTTWMTLPILHLEIVWRTDVNDGTKIKLRQLLEATVRDFLSKLDETR